MDTSVGMQVEFFVWCIIAGASAGILYDLLRISRRLIKTSDVAVNIEDIVFFIIAAGITFAVAFVKNSAELRWYQFLGNAIGFCAYKIAIKDAFLNLGIHFVDWLIKFLIMLAKIIILPVAVVYKILRKPFLVIIWYVRRSFKRAGGVAKIRKERFVKNIQMGKKFIFRGKV